MSTTIKGVAQRVLATLTMATTVLGVAGFTALTPVTALAVAPADYGLTEGDTISAIGSNDPDIYIVNDWGYKRLFVNPAIFTLYGHLSWAGVKSVSPATRDAFGTSGLFRNCETGNQKVYGLEVISEDVAVLHWINTSGAQAVLDDPQFFLKVFCINTNEQNLYGVGADYTSVNQVPDYSRPTGTTTPGSTPPGFNPNGGTQGSIDSLALGSPNKSEALEGQSNVEIYAVDADLSNDGPLLLQSADVWFAETDAGGQSQKPWEYFTSVRLMVGGNTVATLDADALSDWSDFADGHLQTATTTKEYRIRFTGLNAVLPSDATTEISVAVSVVDVIDSADQTATWNTELGEIRVLDESGLVVTENAGHTGVATLEDSFTTGAADIAGLQVRDAASEIEAMVIEVSESADTNNVAIYKFTMEETEGVDLDIDDMQLTFTALSSLSANLNESNVFARARIKEGSTLRGTNESVPDGGVVIFDNVGIHLNANQKKEFTVEVDLRDNAGGTAAANRYDEGATISVTVNNNFVLVDANGNDESDITEDVVAVSNTHSLRTQSISLTFISADIAKTGSRDPAVASSDDQGTAHLKFSVTAFGSDAYVDLSAPLMEAAGSGETALGSTGSASFTYVSTIAADSGVANGTQGWQVLDGATRNFTITTVITGNDANPGVFTDVFLRDLVYALTDVDGNLHYTFNLDDFRTGLLFLASTP